VRTILLDVVALHGAEFGNVQMPVEDRLLIVAQHGLTAPFLETFREVRAEDGCACGRALREGQPILVRDTETDEPYRPFRATARLAGYRSVQSTPMLSSARRFTGVISTLFAHVHEPTRIEMQTVSDYSRIAADHLLSVAGGDDLSVRATELSKKLYSATASQSHA
jgi:GAF domain-containing protein